MESTNNKKRLWYISKYAQDPIFGKPGRQFFYAKNFAAYADVTLVSSRANGSAFSKNFGFKNHFNYKADGVDGVILNGSTVNLGFNIKRIYSWFTFEIRVLIWAMFYNKQMPDYIIVSSLSLLTFITGIILKRKYGCKLICEVRDIWPLTLIETKGLSENNLIIKILSFIEKKGYKNADVVVGTMGNLKKHVQKINPAYTSKVFYLPTGLERSYYREDKAELRRAFREYSKIPSGDFIVGYAGTIGLANCVDHIVKVAEKLKDEKISFILFGDGILKNKIESLIDEKDLNNIILAGKFDKKDIPAILSKCDVLINPWLSGVSIYNYGVSPNKWIDYMLASKPVIVALDGFHNIINEANCGVFVKAGDIDAMAAEIEKFMHMKKDVREGIGRNGYNYLINNLTYNHLAKKYFSIIKNN